MKHIERRTLLSVLAILAFALSAPQLLAATIPAGTTLVVETLDTISSQDRVGKKFAAQLDRDVMVNGTVLLRARTEGCRQGRNVSRFIRSAIWSACARSDCHFQSWARSPDRNDAGIPTRKPKGTKRPRLHNEQQVRVSTWVEDAVPPRATTQLMTEQLPSTGLPILELS